MGLSSPRRAHIECGDRLAMAEYQDYSPELSFELSSEHYYKLVPTCRAGAAGWQPLAAVEDQAWPKCPFSQGK